MNQKHLFSETQTISQIQKSFRTLGLTLLEGDFTNGESFLSSSEINKPSSGSEIQGYVDVITSI